MLKHLDAYHIVLTPHPQDLQLFEENLSKIVHLIQRANYYSITIEHEETNRHLDAVIFIPENKRFNNFINPLYELLHKVFDNSNTQFERLIGGSKRTKKIKKEDIIYVLGYNLKEVVLLDGVLVDCRNWNNLETEKIKEAKEFYEKEKTFRKTSENQIISLNRNNVLFHLIQYFKKNPETKFEDLQIKMISDGYSFVGLTKPSLRRSYLEFLIHTNNHNNTHLSELADEMLISFDTLYNIKVDYFKLKEFINNLFPCETTNKILTFCAKELFTW